MKQFELLAQGPPRLRIQLRWPGFNIFTRSVSVSFLPGVPFFRNSLPPCCVVFWGLSVKGSCPPLLKSKRWSRSLYPVSQNPERNSTVMVGPVHPCDRCTRNSHLFLDSTLPRPLWGSPCGALLFQAAPLSCARPSCMGRWMQGSAIGSPLLGCRGAGPDGSQPRPCQCLPSSTQNSLTCFRISSRAQPSGGAKTWASWLSLDYHHRHLRPRAPPRISWVFCCSYSSASSPSRLPSLAGVAPVATRSIPAVCRSVPQSPENATQDCGSDYTSTACCQRPLVDSARSMYLCVSLPELSSQSPTDRWLRQQTASLSRFWRLEVRGVSRVGLFSLWLADFPRVFVGTSLCVRLRPGFLFS